VFAAKNAFFTHTAVSPTVSFDAVGAGVSGHGSSSVWAQSHTLGGTANTLLVAFSLWSTSNPSSVTAKFNTGSVNIPALVSLPNWTTLSSLPVGLWVFGLNGASVPTGAQTVSITTVGGGATQDGAAISCSYIGGTGFGTAANSQVTSNQTSLSVGPVTATATQMVFSCFSPPSTLSSTLSVGNITSRRNIAWASGLNFALLVGDIVGAGSTTCTATDSAGHPYGAIAVPIL